MPKYLRWEDWNSGLLQEDGFRVYKQDGALGPMNPAALPVPYAELSGDITEFIDADESGAYYIISAYSGAREALSGQIFEGVTWAVEKIDAAVIVEQQDQRAAQKIDAAMIVEREAATAVRKTDAAMIVRQTDFDRTAAPAGAAALTATRQASYGRAIPVAAASAVSATATVI